MQLGKGNREFVIRLLSWLVGTIYNTISSEIIWIQLYVHSSNGNGDIVSIVDSDNIAYLDQCVYVTAIVTFRLYRHMLAVGSNDQAGQSIFDTM